MGITSYLKDKIIKRSLEIKDGRVEMFGKIDYVIFPAQAMSEFLQKIGEDMGEDYLFDLGYQAGEDGAKEMLSKLGLITNTIAKNLRVIYNMFETLGFGKMKIKIIHSERGQVLLNLTDHPAIDYGKNKFGENSKICAHYRGIFSAHGKEELKIKDCKLIETQCITKGDKFCEWSSGYFKNPKQDRG